MKVLNTQELTSAITEFLQKVNPVLFAGAGVSAHTGLPTWRGYLEHLASFAVEHDEETAKLIRHRLEKNQLISAASVYLTCEDIPVGDKYKGLSLPFLNIPAPNKLNALVSLPFAAYITTNYDRSLHDSYANVYKKSPIPVELNDSTLATASYKSEPYIARIHGRAEVPSDIVVSDEHYKSLLKNQNYIDFIVNIFTRNSCLFIGFSFADPAIMHVLSLVEKRLSPDFPSLHLAILPSDSSEDLISLLKRVNIDSVFYDPLENHRVLWESIRNSASNFSSRFQSKNENINEEKSLFKLPIEGIKRYIATAYSHLQMTELEGNALIPLRDIAFDGIVLGMLSGYSKEGRDINLLLRDLKQYLHLPNQELDPILEKRIDALSRRSYIEIIHDKIYLLKEPENSLSVQLSELVNGVINRYEVREGKTPRKETYSIVERVIERVLIIRSWDLGACFAGALNGDIPNVFKTIQGEIEKLSFQHNSEEKSSLARAISNLFSQPDSNESALLSDLGRVAFGLQLITNNPCLTYSEVLPQKIYLDASVLMPAIVDGHPFSSSYNDAINRLRKASSATGNELSIVVIRDFLNEVISHRKLALNEVIELGLENPNELDRYINLYGQDGNVFIVAYSGKVGRLKQKVKFETFLSELAPYSNENQLENFLLKNKGIKTERFIFASDDESKRASEISKKLSLAYEQDVKPGYPNKKPILIEHEANQVGKLIFELEKGIKTIFVTADQRLRRLASDSIAGDLGSAIISHRGFVQLIDLLLGVKADPMSISRLIWGGGFDNQSEAVFAYFTNRALRFYNVAYSMTIPNILSDMEERITREAKKQQIDLTSKIPSEQSRTLRFMDRFEDEFYFNMANAVRDHSPENFNEINQVRKEFLKEKIEFIKTRLLYLEKLENMEKDIKKLAGIRFEISELSSQLSYFESEYKKLTI